MDDMAMCLRGPPPDTNLRVVLAKAVNVWMLAGEECEIVAADRNQQLQY